MPRSSWLNLRGKKILKRMIANLSALSLAQAEAIRAVLKGQPLAPIDAVFEIVRSRAHGAVEAIALAMGRLRLAALLGRESCRDETGEDETGDAKPGTTRNRGQTRNRGSR